MPRDESLVSDIVQAGRLILSFIQGITWEEFARDAKTQSAVIHQLLIIGEAVKGLSESYRQGHAAIPWRAIARMRDRLIHQYRGVDLREVWRTASSDIGQLVEALAGPARAPDAT